MKQKRKRRVNTLVIKGLGSVSLIVPDSSAKRTVDRQLSVVSAQAVQVGIMIREQTTLKCIKRGTSINAQS